MFTDLKQKYAGMLLEQLNDMQEGMSMLSTAERFISNRKHAGVLPAWVEV